MPKQAPAPAPVDPDAPVEVRALCDLPAFGGIAGRVLSVPAGLVPEMRAQFLVDDSPEAVEYARSEYPAPAPQE